MQSKWLSAAFAAAFILSMPWSAQAFECPKHIEAAEDAIDAANDSMIGLKSDLHMHRGHMLLDDAKMLLGSAKHNHEGSYSMSARTCFCSTRLWPTTYLWAGLMLPRR